MKVVALVSGGKDSCYNMILCQKHGHEIIALANLLPVDNSVEELDSFCFQTVGHRVVASYATCCGLPLFRRRFHGIAKQQGLAYSATAGDEVEDLFRLLKAVKEAFPEVQAVSSGAIASDYQRLRVEHVCARLGLFSFAYMWHQPQAKLLRSMAEAGVEAVLIKVAALGLEPRKHLGKNLAQVEPVLHRLREKFDVNVCGEGGEYETLTLDCPIFTKARIVLDKTKVVLHSEGDESQGGVLEVLDFHLEDKDRGRGVLAIDSSNVIDVSSLETLPCGDEPQDEATAGTGGGGCRTSVEYVRSSGGYRHLLCKLWHEGDPKRCASRDYVALFESAGEALSTEGLAWGDALMCNLYLRSMGDFGAINSVYNRYVTQVNPPSRACVELPLPEGQALQLDVILSMGNGIEGSGRRTLHVQSISGWAPPCIGPYSQGVALGSGIVFLAGQISLDPPSLAIVSGGLGPEASQALRNCEAAAVAIRTSIRRGLLAMTAIVSEANSEPLEVLQHEIDAFYQPESSTEDESGSEGEEECPTRHLDPYIRVPEMEVPTWEPLNTFLCVPRLPKDALVEFIPLALLAGSHLLVELEGHRPAQASSSPPWRVHAVGAEDHLVVGCAYLPLSALCQDEDGRQQAFGGAVDAVSGLVGETLTRFGMTWQSLSAVRVYYLANLAEVPEALMSKSSDLHGGPLVMVPVAGVGHSVAMDDAVAIEWLASVGATLGESACPV